MLTSDLVRSKVHGQYIKLRYVEETDAILLKTSKTIIDMFNYHINKSRGELEHCFNEAFEQSSINFTCKGFFRLLEDRSVFNSEAKEDPIVIREKLFLLSAQKRSEGTFDRKEILAEIATSLDLSSEEVEQCLFSDLKDNHRLVAFEEISSEKLLKRYNTSLAQATLLKATKLEIKIKEKNHLRYRQLFRAIKFRQLLYIISGNAQEGFSITLDGPISLFRSSQKYSLQMALFLPALLLCDNWQLKAKIMWKKRAEKIFNLDHKKKLHSHYSDTGMYFPPEMEVFAKRFMSIKSDWTISTECDFFEIESQQICIPDYIFTHTITQKKIYLEIFGFWRKSALEKRLQLINQQEKVIIAISDKMNVDEKATMDEHSHIYYYKSVLIPKEVIKKLEHLKGI